jgi:hypothetical protein
LLSSRWWLPAVLPAVLGQFGVEVASVERSRGSGLILSELLIETEGVRLGVDQIRLPGELDYLRGLRSGTWGSASAVELGTVSVEILPGDSGGSAPPRYLPELVRAVEPGLEVADRWLPPIRVEAVVVSRGAERLVSARALSFADRSFEGVVSGDFVEGAVALRAQLAAGGPWTARLSHEASGLSADLGVEARGDWVRISGRVERAESGLDFAADFGGASWRPLTASAQTQQFRLDPAWLPTGESFAWTALNLSELDLDWDGDRYRGSLSAEAGVRAEALGADTLSVELAVSGDRETLHLEAGSVLASWLKLRLSAPVRIDLRDGSVADRAALQGTVDLEKQAFFAASGRVDLRLDVEPSLRSGPDVGFALSASDLRYGDFALSRVELSDGRWQGERLAVGQLRVQPVDGLAASTITAGGEVRLDSRELDFDYALSLPADWLNAQIGQTLLAGPLMAEGRIGGVVDRPVVAGSLAPLRLEVPALVPITLDGAYRLEGADRLNFSGRATAGEAAIETTLDARVADETVTVDLQRFIWTAPGRGELALEAPTQLSYQYGGMGDVPESRLRVGAFVMAGPDHSIGGRWDAVDGLELSLRNISGQRIARWLQRDLPEVLIESVDVSLPQLRPHPVGSLALRAAGDFVDGEAPLRLALDVELGAAGFAAETVRLDFADWPLIEGSLAAPVRFQIPEAGGRFWQWSESGALEGALSSAVNPAFSDWLEAQTGVRVRKAVMDLAVSGSLEEPLGRLNVRVDSLETPIGGLPAMDRIELVLAGRPDQIEVERLGFLVKGSELSGRFTLPVGGFAEAMRSGSPEWQAWLAGAAGRLELIDWRAEDWVDVLPAMMRRSGHLDGVLELEPGWALSGSLAFRDFALRPTATLPSVDSMGGRIELADRRLRFRDAAARVGGSPVELVGWVDLSDAESPLWQIDVSGRNVPLVRTTDMILRSDLDLQGSRTERDAVPLISGALNLRSSTLLAEFDPLAPNLETGPQSQPPYFSISDPAVADWRFDVKIAGESFMRVRSPYFRTELSANFDLGGSFAAPRLIGSVRTVGGELRFPGAKMRITSGEAYIEPSRPNAVQLDFSGTAQKTSKIISMRVTQTLDDPLIQFQSTPALSNAAIIRLLATGSESGGGAGTVGLYLGQGLLGAGGLDDQLSDRLTVDVGEETSRSGRDTVSARYDISEDYSLEGGYDVYDAYNLDFIWSIFKR